MSNDELRHQFYEEAFYKDCANVPVIELHDVYFDFDKSTLRREGKAALDKALTVIKANHGEDRVTVVGWTDSMGTDAYNLRLSLRRAEAVKAYLAEKGNWPQRVGASRSSTTTALRKVVNKTGASSCTSSSNSV